MPRNLLFSHSGLAAAEISAWWDRRHGRPKQPLPVAVEGCGGIFSFLIDPIVDSKLGLPSAAGHNTAILKGTLKVAAAEAVKASE